MTKVGLYAIDISTTLEPNKSHRGNYICKLLQVAMRPAVDRRTAAEIRSRWPWPSWSRRGNDRASPRRCHRHRTRA